MTLVTLKWIGQQQFAGENDRRVPLNVPSGTATRGKPMVTSTAKTLNQYFEDWLGTDRGSEQNATSNEGDPFG